MAVVFIAATSLPAHGSVMQRKALFSPLKTCATILFYNYYEPNFNIGGRPKGNYIYKLPNDDIIYFTYHTEKGNHN